MKKSIILSSVFFAYFACFAGNIWAGDATLTLDDNAGSSSFVVQDSDKTNQFKVNSDGQGYFAGNVGIGTTNPDGKLEVSTSGAKMYISDTTDNGSPGIVLREGGSTSGYIHHEGDYLTGYLEIEDYSSAWSTTGLVIKQGNVGIGTTNPGSKLTVAGTIESTSGGVKFPDGTTQTTAASGQASIADSSVTTAKLKTATGEVSVTSTGNVIMAGGNYGFYPQLKHSTTGLDSQSYLKYTGDLSTSYVTNIYMNVTAGYTMYALQRYVTASGQDHWLFLLLDKDTRDIVGAYSAPDHPSYGNGGDPDKVQHPFGSYNPEKHEIVIVDNETIKQLKQESSSTGKSLLTLVNEEYKVNKKKAEPYVPLHSGKFINRDGQQVMHMIETLPAYIKVRKLVKLTDEEKSTQETKRQEDQEKHEQVTEKKERDKTRAISKLKKLGLTVDEIEALLFAQK